jgi:hypothetical protein
MVLDLLSTRAAALTTVNRPIEGLVVLEGVQRRAEQMGLSELASRARINLSLHASDDDLRYGFAVAMRGLEEALTRGARSDAAYNTLNGAEFAMHLGELDQSLALTERILSLDLEGSDLGINQAQARIIRLLMGRSDEPLGSGASTDASAVHASLPDDLRNWTALLEGDGATAVERALAMAREDELNAPIAYFRGAIGAAMAGDVVRAREAADEAKALGRWGRWVLACATASEAIALVLEGSIDAGLRVGGETLEVFRTLGVRLDEALLLLGLGIALGQTEPGPSFVAQARGMFVAIGAEGFVDVIDRFWPVADVSGDTPTRHHAAAGEVVPG